MDSVLRYLSFFVGSDRLRSCTRITEALAQLYNYIVHCLSLALFHYVRIEIQCYADIGMP